MAEKRSSNGPTHRPPKQLRISIWAIFLMSALFISNFTLLFSGRLTGLLASDTNAINTDGGIESILGNFVRKSGELQSFEYVGKVQQDTMLASGNTDYNRMTEEMVSVYAPSNRNSTVSICVVVKNETLYIEEWLDFHLALGFYPIHIYDNSEDFELKSWFSKRPRYSSYVKLHHLPMEQGQIPSYEKCIKMDAKHETYVALIDADEFLVLKKHDNVVDLMEEHCDVNCGQLSVNWFMMGIGNETHYRPIPVTNRNMYGSLWSTIKVIVRPQYVADFMDWYHSVRLKKGNWVDTRGKVIKANGWQRQANSASPSEVALLFHYRYKSVEEYRVKTCLKTDVLRKGNPKCETGLGDWGMNGTIFSDLAWRQLKRMVPKYARFDNLNNTTV